MEKGVIIGLLFTVIGAGDDVAEAGMFWCMFWNVEFQVLDLKAGLDVLAISEIVLHRRCGGRF